MNDPRVNAEVAEQKTKKRRVRMKSKYADRFVEIPESAVPSKIVWNRSAGKGQLYYYSLGKNYKKIVDSTTGAATYYKLKDNEAPPIHPRTPAPQNTRATPAAQLDAEPVAKPRKRFKTGTHLWFVDTTGAWFLCEVVSWSKMHRLVIRPVTGRDSERRVDWPYGHELEFPGVRGNRLYDRLRPLADKAP